MGTTRKDARKRGNSLPRLAGPAKTIREMILRPLTTGIFLSPFPAVGTDVLDPVLLGIAVQSRPTGAAYADNFR